MVLRKLRNYIRNRRVFVAALLLAVAAVIAWQFGPAIQAIVRDRKELQQFVDDLGWLGPIALICFNAIQIIVAPIPGYIVQLAAGFLYGPWWGGLWSTLGLFAGSMSAMWLARTFGRPLVARVIGVHRLQQWEEYIHTDSIYVWFILLLGPTGDAPFYLAGLSQVRFHHIALITLLIRVPSVFVAAAIGAGVIALTWWQFTLIIAGFGLFAFALLRYKATLSAWLDRIMKAMMQQDPPSYIRSREMELSTPSDE